MVNYLNGKVYMMTAIDAVEGDGNVYIGSTTKKYHIGMITRAGNLVPGTIQKYLPLNYSRNSESIIVLLETCPCVSCEA
jgi:hypothetical protein